MNTSGIAKVQADARALAAPKEEAYRQKHDEITRQAEAAVEGLV